MEQFTPFSNKSFNLLVLLPYGETDKSYRMELFVYIFGCISIWVGCISLEYDVFASPLFKQILCFNRSNPYNVECRSDLFLFEW